MPLIAPPTTSAGGNSVAPFRRRVRLRERSLPKLAAEAPSQSKQSTVIEASGTSADAGSPRKSSIRQLRVTFEETPLRLRDLEERWRARRRRVLGIVNNEARQSRTTESSRMHRQEGLEIQAPNAVISQAIPVGLGEQARYSGSTAQLLPPASGAHVALSSGVQTRHLLHQQISQNVMASTYTTRRAMSFATAPPTPPTSPSSSLRRLNPPPQDTSCVFPADRPAAQPILAHPLPPTTFPIPLWQKSSKDTIHIQPPDSQNELVISLGTSKRSVIVTRGGLEIIVGNHVVRLLAYSAWGKRERKEWEIVLALVERVKQRTPRVSSSPDQKRFS